MATIGIEIVDAALIAARDGERIAASPGIALVDGGRIVAGDAATGGARLRPASASDRFWTDLAPDSVVHTHDSSISHADLAHAHLAGLWRSVSAGGDEAVFAVPGSMKPREAGLLLGIARHAGIAVAGVVDSAVAACAGLAARGTVLHLDVQLYRAVLTEMQGSQLLRRRRVEIAPRVGLKAMFGAWAQLVAESMVRRTRFDPLHEAASEQQLYERLPEWLAELGTREVHDVTVDGATGSFTATVRRDQFTLAAEAWYAQLAELARTGHRPDEPATLALSARAALLPQFAERVGARSGLDVVVLPDAAPAIAAAERAAELGPADPPALVTALKRTHAIAGGERRRTVGVPATHVILEGRAHLIDEIPLVVGLGGGEGRRIGLAGVSAGISTKHCSLVRRGGRAVVEDHSRYGTFVNGDRIEGEAELGAGDRLRVGTPGIVLELVAVG